MRLSFESISLGVFEFDLNLVNPKRNVLDELEGSKQINMNDAFGCLSCKTRSASRLILSFMKNISRTAPGRMAVRFFFIAFFYFFYTIPFMLFLIPTDTCYGLAGEFSEQDYSAINVLKGRDDTKRLALLVEDFSDMKQFVTLSDEQIDFLRNYPHPWSFLGTRSSNFQIPEWMDGGKYEKISLRVAKVCIPNYSRALFGDTSFPFFLTSANLSGHSESKTLIEAESVFPGIFGIDGGLCNRPPSDIFSMNESGELEYLRRNYNVQ